MQTPSVTTKLSKLADMREPFVSVNLSNSRAYTGFGLLCSVFVCAVVLRVCGDWIRSRRRRDAPLSFRRW